MQRKRFARNKRGINRSHILRDLIHQTRSFSICCKPLYDSRILRQKFDRLYPGAHGIMVYHQSIFAITDKLGNSADV